MMCDIVDYDMKIRKLGPIYMRRLEMFSRKDSYK